MRPPMALSRVEVAETVLGTMFVTYAIRRVADVVEVDEQTIVGPNSERRRTSPTKHREMA